MTDKKTGAVFLFVFLFVLLTFVHPVFCAQYTVTVRARSGGTIIAPDGNEIRGVKALVFKEGDTPEFRFVPDPSRRLSDVVLDSLSLGSLSGDTYTLASIKGDHEIIGVFSDDNILISESAGDDQIFTSLVSLSQTFKDMISKGLSYTAPVVSPDKTNGTQSGDSIYMTFFRPMEKEQWHGNLKKYKVEYLERTDCTGRDNPELTVMDMDGNIAVDCNGAFLETSISCWSDSFDGGFSDKGGVGKILLDSLIEVNSSIPVNQYHSFRNIKTYLGDSTGSIVSFDRTNITKDVLGVGDDATRDRIINYIYGYSYDAESDGRPVKKRSWILGDIIHSETKIIDYFDPATGNLQYRYLAVGSNDGMLHVFADTTIFFNGKIYSPGEEIFAFIPTDILQELKTIAVPSEPHKHTVDGSPNIFRPGTIDPGSGYLHKTLVFGERRGGRSYWALDVTNPDPSTWTVKWHITGGTGGIATPVTRQIDELGYTWSKPFFSEIKISESESKNIMIFAGGYDPLEDGFPEAFIDGNNNGARDTGEAHAVTVGGTEGYDKYNPGIDEMGRGIFVIDIDNGSPLFTATYNKNTEKTTGVAQTYNAMKYCFPADISVIPFSDSDLLMYASDIYGQIWKVKYDYYADTVNSFKSDLSTRWSVKRIFTANPGSDLVSGTGDGLIIPFTDTDPGTPGLNNTDQGRKTFYSPDISYFGNEWTSKPVLYFGTGDRAHLRYTMISNRFYAVTDNDSLTYETDLLNLTCNELDLDADADNDGMADDAVDDETVRENLKNLFLNRKVNGFYRIMDEQGACKDSSTYHSGEHIISQPTLFAGIIYFTSYQPVPGDPTNPTGNSFSYALDYSFGTSVLNYSISGQNNHDPRTLEDTFFIISDSSISSGIQIITRGGKASGLVNSGGKVSGMAEDRSMDIPGPPGGVSQMLWEID